MRSAIYLSIAVVALVAIVSLATPRIQRSQRPEAPPAEPKSITMGEPVIEAAAVPEDDGEIVDRIQNVGLARALEELNSDTVEPSPTEVRVVQALEDIPSTRQRIVNDAIAVDLEMFEEVSAEEMREMRHQIVHEIAMEECDKIESQAEEIKRILELESGDQ